MNGKVNFGINPYSKNDSSRYLILTFKQWQDEREAKVFGINFTDEQLERAKSKDGFIDSKFGVDCYLAKNTDERFI